MIVFQKFGKTALTLTVMFLFSSGHFLAQEKPKKPEEGKEEVKKEEPKEKPEYPPLEEMVKGMDKIEGFFTLYRKEERLYALVKAGQMKQPFFLAMTLSGGIYAGMQWDTMLVYWEPLGNKLLLVRPEVRHRATQTTFEDVVARTYPSTILRGVMILSKTAGGDVLIDFSPIFKSDLAGISALAPFLLDSQGHFNPELSKWSKVKVFSENVELEVEAAFTGPHWGGC